MPDGRGPKQLGDGGGCVEVVGERGHDRRMWFAGLVGANAHFGSTRQTAPSRAGRSPLPPAPSPSSRSAGDSACAASRGAALRPATPPAERARRQQVADGHEIPEALRHLLALDLQEAVVHPDVRHAAVPKAQQDCAISFSWCGKTRSMPPPWMSNTSPRCCQLMAEHSMCQPGRPGPRCRRATASPARRAWTASTARSPSRPLVGRHVDARAGHHLVERAVATSAP